MNTFFKWARYPSSTFEFIPFTDHTRRVAKLMKMKDTMLLAKPSDGMYIILDDSIWR